MSASLLCLFLHHSPNYVLAVLMLSKYHLPGFVHSNVLVNYVFACMPTGKIVVVQAVHYRYKGLSDAGTPAFLRYG